MVYNFDINNRAFNAIKNNTKRVEIRATKVGRNYFDYSILTCDDEIIFENYNHEKILCKIIEINHYNSIEELLIQEGTRYTLSSTNDYNKGIKSINSLDGYKEAIKVNGIFAIHIKYIKEIN